jgi:hypothetical protein
LLTQTHGAIQARAAELEDDALRRSFLERVPPNRDIISAWAAVQAST